jgi:argininosuccinate synthase
MKQNALASGASQFVLRDLKSEFAENYLYPLIRSGAVYEHKYLLGTALARPLIAAHQVALAQEVGADALAHGGTGKGNDQVRFELTYMALDPTLTVIAPWREWDIRTRADALAYARGHNIPVPATAGEKRVYSRDRNLWHYAHEGGPLEEAWDAPEEAMYLLSASPENALDKAAYATIDFENGSPTSVDGEALHPVEMIQRLNTLGAMHGIGRADVVESRLVGLKSHGVYETPAGTILTTAHREVESLVLDKDTLQFKAAAALKYAELIYNGLWFSPLRESLDAFFNNTQIPVSGTIRLKLYKGNVIPVGRKSPNSLYRDEYATFGLDDVYDQQESQGFTNVFGLHLKVRALNRLTPGGKIPKPDYTRFKRD